MVKTPKNDLTDADYEALSNLRYTLRRFMDFSASAAQEEGLPAQQHQALLAIRGHRGEDAMTIGILAERLLIAPHSATELVSRLVAAGYVSRQTDPADKRRQTLELTEKANDALKRLTAIHLTEIREMAPRLIDILQGLQAGGELEADPWAR
ncbi:MarR family winged helix-turn-helix transcriptional regulator [Rhizobium sp. BK377]|uniref:MarR family winged helix-turn-helix transcriptional regulator n=1 Tax=Rhizobium sp. BK377 TaxID=2587058 RepID=UPI00391849D4